MIAIFSERRPASSVFYSYLSLHSLLIGLFPFFIPVYLWRNEYSLSSISLYISLSGAGFCAALWLWDRWRKTARLNTLIGISFALESILLSSVFLQADIAFLPLMALLYGLYNCFFWITNRALFLEIIDTSNSGKKYGNLQIAVVIMLKIGVFAGGILLEKYGFTSVYLISIIITLASAIGFARLNKSIQFSPQLRQSPPISLPDLMQFKDALHSRRIFLLDGLFLFLESYFWVISLFLLAHESFWQLGILVIVLGITFSGLFFFIRSTIDRLSRQTVYLTATLLYILSWILRATLSDQLPMLFLFLLLVLITFCTSFFRLSFNKRFFDNALETSGHRYLIIKSYYSQFIIAIGYFAIAVLLNQFADPPTALRAIYAGAAVLAMGYFWYGFHPPATTSLGEANSN